MNVSSDVGLDDAALIGAIREAGRERVHVHFDDGSMVTLADDAPDAQPLLALARPAL